MIFASFSNGLIAKIACTQRYQLASLRRRVVVLFTRTYDRARWLRVRDPVGHMAVRSTAAIPVVETIGIC